MSGCEVGMTTDLIRRSYDSSNVTLALPRTGTYAKRDNVVNLSGYGARVVRSQENSQTSASAGMVAVARARNTA
jgi:hypothetical protein